MRSLLPCYSATCRSPACEYGRCLPCACVLDAGTKAQLQTPNDLTLTKIAVGANVMLNSVIYSPYDNSSYTGPLKTGFLVCNNGTEAYVINNTARVPAPLPGTSYADTVVVDNSCRPCDSNMYAKTTGV